MLIIDDNKMKLLKMKEKLLEISFDNIDNILADYKKIIIDIDSVAYNDLLAEINEIDYNNLSLEEQIDYLTKIADDYTYLNELQCTFKNSYQKYSHEELNLSDISIIGIDDIKERISAIQGYLINQKNLENNKLELDNLNTEYIKANKKNILILEQISQTVDNIKNDFLLTEGRIQDDNSEMEYTSILKEYQTFDLDLKKLLTDQDYLNDVYIDSKNEYKDREETLSVALICNQNGYNNNKDVCDRIKLDTLKSKYKLILVSLAKEVSTKTEDYNLLKNKLNKILDLIKERKKVLQELNIKHFIDPFDRLNINKYIELISLLEDNKIKTDNITKTIMYFMTIIEEMTAENTELLNKINSQLIIINDNKEVSENTYENITDHIYLDPDNNNLDSLINVADKDDLVVNIRDYSENFLIDRVLEKTSGVIHRVNEMFNEETIIPEEKHYEVSPKLVIDNVVSNQKNNIENISDIFLDNSSVEETKNIDKKESINVDDNASKENINLSDIFLNETNNNIFEDNNLDTIDNTKQDNENIKSETTKDNMSDIFIDNSEDTFVEKGKEELENEMVLTDPFPDSNNEIKVNNDNPVKNDIFEEVEPFEVTPLFNERYDDEIFVNNNKIYEDSEDTMPDIFWNVSEENKPKTDNDDNDETALSFDEQIEELISDPKTRRKVA